jgi:prepilin-type processing-associated H-X9-DG protein
MSSNAKYLRAGLSRIEVLVLCAALWLLAAAGAASQRLRGYGQTAACMNNLRRIGQASVLVAAQDKRMIPHRQSSVGVDNWVGLGQWDWGGADGMVNYFNTAWSSLAMGVKTRPYNEYLGFEDGFDAYHCPGDTGVPENPNIDFADWYGNTFRESVFGAAGNSYQGDGVMQQIVNLGGYPPHTRARVGSFMRPYDLFPRPDETLLFHDTVMVTAYISTEELNTVGYGVEPLFVDSWHPPEATHNVLFVDGHVRGIEIRPVDSLISPDTFPTDIYPYRDLMIRGDGWRYDAFPDSLIIETFFGDPAPVEAPLSHSPTPLRPLGLIEPG